MAVLPHPGTNPLVDALVPLTPSISDPTNARGLGSSAIICGVIYLFMVSGVTTGAGQTTAVQTATLTAINNAIAVGNTNGIPIQGGSYTYETYGSTGVVFPTGGTLKFDAQPGFLISSFYVNAPAVVFGDSTGASVLYGAQINGVTAQYGVSQTGNTSAVMFLGGSMSGCKLTNISSLAGATFPLVNPPYNAMQFKTGGIFENNTFRNISLFGAQNLLLSREIGGLIGNTWDTVTLSNGANVNSSASHYGSLTTAALNIGNSSYSAMNGDIWNNLAIINCGAANIAMITKGNATFTGLQVRNCTITGQYGQVIADNSSNIHLRGTYITDLRNTAGSGCTLVGTAGAGEVITIDGWEMDWSTNASGGFVSNVSFFYQNGNNDQNLLIDARNIVIVDTPGNNSTYLRGNGAQIPLQYVGAGYNSQLGRFHCDQVSYFTESWMPNISANYTHYGCHRAAVLMVPATLSAAATITLAATMYASGTLGYSVAPRTGETVRIRRCSGTYANTLTIVDGASSTTLATNSASGSDYFYRFNGTNWVSAA